MNKIHLRLSDGMKRSLYVVAAFLITTASVFSGMIERASAATQVTTRSIKMSDSNLSTTGVSYKVTFNTATDYSSVPMKGVVVDFCDNDPLPGDSCTAPTGFSVTGSPAVDNATSSPNPTGNWSVASSNTNRTVTLTNSSGITPASGATVTFTLTTITNPSTANHSFYARIFTYTSTTTGYTTGGSGNEGAYAEYGGIALSTGRVINITAKVQETLQFCVFDGSPTKVCGDDPSFTIGHNSGPGTPTIIDSSVVDTFLTKFSLSTNANGGVAVRMKGDTLKSGANDIDPAGTGGPPRTTAAAIVAGTENFGFYLSTLGTNIAVDNGYSSTAGSYLLTNGGATAGDITSLYGGQFAHLTAPTSGSTTTITFGATASATTPAGTYTASEQLIATGTF